jgi:hypothetical protein
VRGSGFFFALSTPEKLTQLFFKKRILFLFGYRLHTPSFTHSLSYTHTEYIHIQTSIHTCFFLFETYVLLNCTLYQSKSSHLSFFHFVYPLMRILSYRYPYPCSSHDALAFISKLINRYEWKDSRVRWVILTHLDLA